MSELTNTAREKNEYRQYKRRFLVKLSQNPPSFRIEGSLALSSKQRNKRFHGSASLSFCYHNCYNNP